MSFNNVMTLETGRFFSVRASVADDDNKEQNDGRAKAATVRARSISLVAAIPDTWQAGERRYVRADIWSP